MAIRVNIDILLAMRKMPAGELAERIGITLPNLSILKNDKAKAIRFSTLNALCRELNCQPGDLITFVPDDENTDQKEEPESWNKI